MTPVDPGAGVLLLHGFTGTPYELAPLDAALRAAGYECHSPLLHGHGRGVRALAHSSAADWVRSAEHGLMDLYERLQRHPRPRLAVVGLSMGGLLTLRLAARYAPLIRALVLLAPALALYPGQERLIRALARGPGAYVSLPKLFGSDVRDRAARRANPATWAMPLRSLRSLTDLMAEVRALVPEVRHPALLVHGAHDKTIPPAVLGELAARIGTPPAELRLLWLSQSAHVLPIDLEREALAAAVLDHLGRYLPARPGADSV